MTCRNGIVMPAKPELSKPTISPKNSCPGTPGKNGMSAMRALLLVWPALLAALAGAGAAAAEPFYRGKRLNLIINFAAGGPSDIEGRLLVKHIVKHLDGAPNIIVQNKDGAGGLIGANDLGELGPKDGTMFGYITGAAWHYVTDPSASRVDLKNYEFIAYQPGNAVYFVRSEERRVGKEWR